MEEKKEIKLDLKSIGKAASALKTLSDSLKDCQEQMKQMKEGNVSVMETSLDKGTQRKTTENELPSLTQCTA